MAGNDNQLMGGGPGGAPSGAPGGAQLPNLPQNPMASGQTPNAIAPSKMTGNPMLDQAAGLHNQTKAQYDQINRSGKMIDAMRKEMDLLVQMGDTVTPADVVKAAGRVTSHGVDPHELAVFMSTMPTQGGQGLAAWLMQNDAMITQQEQEIRRVQSIAGYRLGVSAIRGLAALHVHEQGRAAMARMGQLSGAAGGGMAGPPGGGGTPMVGNQMMPDENPVTGG